MSYEVLESKELFHGKVMNVEVDTVVMPDGKTATRETVLRGNASAIVPIDKDGTIIFVRQYRHPLKELVLEIPAGMIDKNEDPFVCAARELEEETGYRSDNITLLAEMHSAIGFCTEKLFIYTAKNLKAGKQNFDEDEFIELEKYSLEEAIQMIFDGRITDSKTMVGILGYKELLSKQK